VKVLLLAATLAGSVAMAEDLPPITSDPVSKGSAVTETKTKITCSVDEKGSMTDPSGKVSRTDRNGKISESIRTSWKANGVEYRFSEYKGFDESGAVNSIGRAQIKVTEKTEGKNLTETVEATHISYMLGGRRYKEGAFREQTATTVNVIEVDGNVKTTVKSTVDGKEDSYPATATTEIKLSDTLTVLTTTMSKPYEEVVDGYKYSTERSQSVCLLELLK